MTTTITVEVHCSEDKEVVIRDVTSRDSNRDKIIKNGDVEQALVYDDKQILIFERPIPTQRK